MGVFFMPDSTIDLSSSFGPLPLQAGATSIGGLFRNRARIDRDAVALIEGEYRLSFGELNSRVNRLAHVLAKEGVQRGDRIAILSRNCTAYVEVELAAAKLGAMVAAINWRLADPELIHCINLADSSILLVAEDYIDTVNRLDIEIPLIIELGADYEARLARAESTEPPEQAQS